MFLFLSPENNLRRRIWQNWLMRILSSFYQFILPGHKRLRHLPPIICRDMFFSRNRELLAKMRMGKAMEVLLPRICAMSQDADILLLFLLKEDFPSLNGCGIEAERPCEAAIKDPAADARTKTPSKDIQLTAPKIERNFYSVFSLFAAFFREIRLRRFL